MNQTTWPAPTPTPPPPPGWGHTPPPPPPPGGEKKSWAGKVLLALAAIVVLGAIVGSSADDTSSSGSSGLSASSSGSSGSSASAVGHKVTYKVEGTTNMASITYSNAYGDTSQQSDIDVPLTRKSDGGQGIVLNGMSRGDFLYIAAQNSQDYGSVTCIIEVDGVVVKRNTSHGAYTIATCSGSL